MEATVRKVSLAVCYGLLKAGAVKTEVTKRGIHVGSEKERETENGGVHWSTLLYSTLFYPILLLFIYFCGRLVSFSFYYPFPINTYVLEL